MAKTCIQNLFWCEVPTWLDKNFGKNIYASVIIYIALLKNINLNSHKYYCILEMKYIWTRIWLFMAIKNYFRIVTGRILWCVLFIPNTKIFQSQKSKHSIIEGETSMIWVDNYPLICTWQYL